MRNPNESEEAREARHRREWAADAAYRERSARESAAREIAELKQQLLQLRQETPNPTNWQLMDVQEIGPYTVLKVQYSIKLHNGVKILVYRAKLADLVKQKSLDPHFGGETSTGGRPRNYLYPIARFEPTDDGWHDAIAYAARKSGRA